RANLDGEVAGHEVNRIGQVPPCPAHARHLRLAAEAALRAHLARHPGDLAGERGELVNHGVDGVLELQDLAASVHSDILAQVALGDGGRDLRDVADLAGRVAPPDV